MASENSPNDSKGQYISKEDVIANSWIFLFAGHETTANTLHFAFLFLATDLVQQARLQDDIDSVVGSWLPEEWTYEADMGHLYGTEAVVEHDTRRLLLISPLTGSTTKHRPQNHGSGLGLSHGICLCYEKVKYFPLSPRFDSL